MLSRSRIEHVQQKVEDELDVVLSELGIVLVATPYLEAQGQDQVEHQGFALVVDEQIVKAETALHLMVRQLKSLLQGERIAQDKYLQ